MIIYGEVKEAIKKYSVIQLADLFIYVAEECIEKDCFRSGVMGKVAAKIEEKIRTEKGEIEYNLDIRHEIVELTCSKCHASFTLGVDYIHRICGLSGCNGRLHRL